MIILITKQFYNNRHKEYELIVDYAIDEDVCLDEINEISPDMTYEFEPDPKEIENVLNKLKKEKENKDKAKERLKNIKKIRNAKKKEEKERVKLKELAEKYPEELK